MNDTHDHIAQYLGELRRELRAGRRLRRARLLVETRDHLLEATEELQHSGLSRDAAAAAAIQRFGTPQQIARQLPRQPLHDLLLEFWVYVGGLLGLLLATVGTLFLTGELLTWALGRAPLSPRGVRIWRTCQESVNGECVGGWSDQRLGSMLLAGGLLLLAGLLLVSVLTLLKRRFILNDDDDLQGWLFGRVGFRACTLLALVLLLVGLLQTVTGGGSRWLPLWLPGGALALGLALWFRHRSQHTGPTVLTG